MKTNIVDTTGKKIGQMELPKEIFGVTPNQELLSQYIRVYRHRQRQAGAVAQTRSDVTGTSAKVWRQKGTGRARHGARTAPIFVKGGQAHGPTGNQNYTLSMSKRMRKQALVSALSSKADTITVIEGLDKVKAKTKDVSTTLSKALDWQGGSMTLILDTPLSQLIQGGKNIKNLEITQVKRLNAYEVLQSKRLVFTKEGIELLSQLLQVQPTKTKKVESNKKS